MKLKLNNVSVFSEEKEKFCSEKTKENEDSFFISISREEGFLFGVADGVGSYKGAKEASNFVCNYIPNISNLNHNYLEHSLRKDLNENFEEYIKGLSTDYFRASTTLSFCFLNDDGLSIWHAGDSRIYIKKDNKLVQLTNDHTEYQELLDQKIYSKRELKEKNISSSTLTNAVSTFMDLENDYTYIPYESLKEDYGQDISIYLMSDGAYHFWDLKKSFSKSTMDDTIKFTNALKRRIEKKGPIDDYTLIAFNFHLSV